MGQIGEFHDPFLHLLDTDPEYPEQIVTLDESK